MKKVSFVLFMFLGFCASSLLGMKQQPQQSLFSQDSAFMREASRSWAERRDEPDAARAELGVYGIAITSSGTVFQGRVSREEGVDNYELRDFMQVERFSFAQLDIDSEFADFVRKDMEQRELFLQDYLVRWRNLRQSVSTWNGWRVDWHIATIKYLINKSNASDVIREEAVVNEDAEEDYAIEETETGYTYEEDVEEYREDIFSNLDKAALYAVVHNVSIFRE